MSLQETYAPSYAGVSFIVETSKTKGGRKNVVKQFPNSSVQKFQDLGLKPRNYSLDAIITANLDGTGLFENRDAFLRVLEKGGTDVLVHPFYGRIENVAVSEYLLDESFYSLGEAKFFIQFEVSGTNGLPNNPLTIKPEIANLKEITIAAVNSDIENNFSVSPNAPENFTFAMQDLREIIAATKKNATFLAVLPAKIDAFSADLINALGALPLLINNPARLTSSITGLFRQIRDMYPNLRFTLKVMSRFFKLTLSQGESLIEGDTYATREQITNTMRLQEYIKAMALVQSYEIVSQIDYADVVTLDQDVSLLDAAYNEVMAQQSLDAKAYEAIEDFRNSAVRYFEQQKNLLAEIVSVSSPSIPASALAYRYFGDTIFTDNIIGLNADLNISFYQGQVKVPTV